MNIKNLIDELAEKHILKKEELIYIIENKRFISEM